MRSRSDYYEQGTIDWYKTGELADWYLSPAEERITEKALEETSVKLFPPGTVLMAMYGDGRTITSLGLLREPAATNQACAAMLVDKAKCDPRYFFYALKSRRHVLLKLATGGAQRNLSGKLVKQFALPVPSPVLQRRIVEILSPYDELIEVNTRRIAILDELARRLFDEWFIKFRFPGHETAPMVDGPSGGIPADWQVRAIGDAWEVVGGGTPSRAKSEYWQEGTINWFTPSDLTGSETSFVDRSSSLITEKGLKESSARLFPAKSIMMTSRATLGVVAINAEAASTNQGFITCMPNEDAPLYFLYHWLKSNADEFERHASGATFKEITKGVFKKLPVLLPPRALTARYEAVAGPWMELSHSLQRANRLLRASSDLLLPKLISGEIDLERAEVENESLAAE